MSRVRVVFKFLPVGGLEGTEGGGESGEAREHNPGADSCKEVDEEGHAVLFFEHVAGRVSL